MRMKVGLAARGCLIPLIALCLLCCSLANPAYAFADPSVAARPRCGRSGPRVRHSTASAGGCSLPKLSDPARCGVCRMFAIWGVASSSSEPKKPRGPGRGRRCTGSLRRSQGSPQRSLTPLSDVCRRFEFVARLAYATADAAKRLALVSRIDGVARARLVELAGGEAAYGFREALPRRWGIASWAFAATSHGC